MLSKLLKCKSKTSESSISSPEIKDTDTRLFLDIGVFGFRGERNLERVENYQEARLTKSFHALVDYVNQHKFW